MVDMFKMVRQKVESRRQEKKYRNREIQRNHEILEWLQSLKKISVRVKEKFGYYWQKTEIRRYNWGKKAKCFFPDMKYKIEDVLWDMEWEFSIYTPRCKWDQRNMKGNLKALWIASYTLLHRFNSVNGNKRIRHRKNTEKM
jgi:hypothetical protein